MLIISFTTIVNLLHCSQLVSSIFYFHHCKVRTLCPIRLVWPLSNPGTCPWQTNPLFFIPSIWEKKIYSQNKLRISKLYVSMLEWYIRLYRWLWQYLFQLFFSVFCCSIFFLSNSIFLEQMHSTLLSKFIIDFLFVQQ